MTSWKRSCRTARPQWRGGRRTKSLLRIWGSPSDSPFFILSAGDIRNSPLRFPANGEQLALTSAASQHLTAASTPTAAHTQIPQEGKCYVQMFHSVFMLATYLWFSHFRSSCVTSEVTCGKEAPPAHCLRMCVRAGQNMGLKRKAHSLLFWSSEVTHRWETEHCEFINLNVHAIRASLFLRQRAIFLLSLVVVFYVVIISWLTVVSHLLPLSWAPSLCLHLHWHVRPLFPQGGNGWWQD